MLYRCVGHWACELEYGEWQAVVSMRDLLQDSYSDTSLHSNLRAAQLAPYHPHYGKAVSQSNCFLHVEEDVTAAVANAAHVGVGYGALCMDVVESLNAIWKRAYSDYMARGGGNAGGNIARPGGRGGVANLGEVILEI